jgi:arylsulfatase A-like enzyme
LENTLVVYTSDQGYAWGQHGSSAKWLGYDANIAAPLIFSQPGRIEAKQVCAEPVTGLDIVKTFHSVADIKPVMELHGRDMSPLLEDPSRNLKSPLVFTHTARLYGERFLAAIKQGRFVGKGKMPAYLMMREGKYKYIRHMQNDTLEELYDLDEDGEELNNLAVDSGYGGLLKRLREKAVVEIRKKDGEFVDYLPKPRER